MSVIVDNIVESCQKSQVSFCKFISANDVGKTGSHQYGFYIPKNSYSLLFDTPGIKGENKSKNVDIYWQDGSTTQSRFIYYGKGTRNEYRITRFGRNFPYLTDNNVGNLLILTKINEFHYNGFVLESEIDVNDFLSIFGMYPSDTNTLIDTQNGVLRNSSTLYPLFNDYIVELTVEFPNSIEISNKARLFSKISKENKEQDYFDVINYPDRELLQWLDVEYSLFKAIEYDRYLHFIEKPFSSIDSLVEAANTILNRRKSRAGKSLENHLSEIFTMNNLPFTSQPTTEGRKKPDFIFPGKDYYFDNNYKKNLVFLASKTTCKDRWRQILNEADRIKQKHLFTLQQGISEYQMDEMADNGVILVVPEKYKSTYPSAYSDEILSLKEFISHVESKISDVYVQSGQEDN